MFSSCSAHFTKPTSCCTPYGMASWFGCTYTSLLGMACKLCSILLSEQRRRENLSAGLENLKTSGEEGCEGCQLVVQSIEHFFRDNLRKQRGPDTSWEVTPGWLRCPSWKRGLGAISLIESQKLDDPGGVSALDLCMGTVYMYCLPGVYCVFKQAPTFLHNRYCGDVLTMKLKDHPLSQWTSQSDATLLEILLQILLIDLRSPG
jgi:hypothetical protein